MVLCVVMEAYSFMERDALQGCTWQEVDKNIRSEFNVSFQVFSKMHMINSAGDEV